MILNWTVLVPFACIESREKIAFRQKLVSRLRTQIQMNSSCLPSLAAAAWLSYPIFLMRKYKTLTSPKLQIMVVSDHTPS
jgi:hypothetical protein